MIWDFLEPKREEAEPEITEREVKVGDSAHPPAESEPEPQECDYEKNCTPLYGYIEGAVRDTDWDPIVKFLDSGYWPSGGLFADSMTPAQQARTWVTRFDPNDKTKVRWSQLPLHLAIVCGAPFSVVGRLIEAYPQAVRCTDDQRMLPLHLALRHNACDDVVAYLLMQFPESVNAKGKDGRLPIQCALRANSKVRGKILEIFVKKTKNKHKIAMGGGNALEKELHLVKSNLEAKSLALENAESKLAALEKFKSEIETELSNQTEQLNKVKASQENFSAESVKDLEDKRLVEQLALSKKIEKLEQDKQAAIDAEKKARASEVQLRGELENVTKAVATTRSAGELTTLKKEVEVLQVNHMESARTDAQEQIDVLRRELEDAMKGSNGKTDKELKAMHTTVKELHSAAGGTRAVGDLNSLRTEVQSLRDELRAREEKTQTKNELAEIKESLEEELKNSEGKTQEELKSIKAAIATMNNMDSKTNEELTSLKKELATVKKELKESELTSKTHQDVVQLKATLERELTEAKGSTAKELASTKKTLDHIQEELQRGRSSEELLKLRKEVDGLKAEVREKEESSKLRSEMLSIKEDLEKEIKQSEGKTRGELASIKKAVKMVDDKHMKNLSADELASQKAELDKVKATLDRKEDESKTRQEIASLKKSLDENVKAWDGKNKDDISVMKEAVDQLSVNPIETKSSTELLQVKKELSKLREDVKTAEDATKTKQELDTLKTTLDEALKTSEGKTSEELVAMKRAVDSINVEQLEIKNKDEWDMIRAELNALKEDLKTKEAGEGILKKEIADLKAQLPKDRQMKKKPRGWKKLLSRFRRGKETTAHSVVSTASTPQIRNFVTQDEDDVVTIHPPSVHHTANEDDEDVEEDSTRPEIASKASVASKHSTTKSMKSSRTSKTAPSKIPCPQGENLGEEMSRSSKKSVKSTKSTKSYSSKNSKMSNYKQASKAAISAAKIVEEGVNVDPETGETIYAEEKEHRMTEGRPVDALSV